MLSKSLIRTTLAIWMKERTALQPGEIDTICSFFEPEIVTQEELLLKEGDRYRKVVFVVKGILRVFVIDSGGEEIVKNFIEAGQFFSVIESFYDNAPAPINVSAVTDCQLLTLQKPDADRLVKILPQWEILMKEGAMHAMNDMIRKQNFLKSGTAAEQYRHFVEHYPSLAKQVPLKYIASYLRITQSSLSRIRKQGW